VDTVRGEPTFHLADGVAMLFRMLVLIAKPRLAPRRFVAAVPQHGVERHDAKPCEARHGAPEAERNTGERVVHTDDDDSARARQFRDARKRARGVCGVMEHPGGVHDIKRFWNQPRTMQIRLDELRGRDPVSPCRAGGKK